MKLHTWMEREGLTLTSERCETTGGRSIGLWSGEALIIRSVSEGEQQTLETMLCHLNRLGHEVRAHITDRIGLIWTQALQPSTLTELAHLVEP